MKSPTLNMLSIQLGVPVGHVRGWLCCRGPWAVGTCNLHDTTGCWVIDTYDFVGPNAYCEMRRSSPFAPQGDRAKLRFSLGGPVSTYLRISGFDGAEALADKTTHPLGEPSPNTRRIHAGKWLRKQAVPLWVCGKPPPRRISARS